KDQIYVGKQAQYNAYKQALKTRILSQKSQQANYNAQQQEEMLHGDPAWSGETAGPHHIQVQVFDGFGPMELDRTQLELGLGTMCPKRSRNRSITCSWNSWQHC